MEDPTLWLDFFLTRPLYYVELDEHNRPTIAVILDPFQQCIQRMFIDRVYNRQIWVRHSYPGALRVTTRLFAQACVALGINHGLLVTDVSVS